MNLRHGYQRIVLILAVLAGLLGMAAGATLVAEEAQTSQGLAMAALRIVGGLVFIPCFAFAYTWSILWFGGLGISRLVVWVVRGFEDKPEAETGRSSVRRTVSPLRITCAVITVVLLIVVGCLFALPRKQQSVKQPPKQPPVPCSTLCEIPIEDVEGYDLSLDTMGTLSGFIKNGSGDILKEVDTHVVVRNSRKDIIFQGCVTLRCEVPPGEARPFSYHNAVPSHNLPCKYSGNGRGRWTLEGSFEADKVAARGCRLVRLEDICETPEKQKKPGPDIFDKIAGECKEQRRSPDGTVAAKRSSVSKGTP